MNARLAGLIAVGGVVVIGGTTYLVGRIEPGDLPEALDAGLLDECERVPLECEGRITCEGFNRRYVTAPVPGAACPQADGGAPILVVRPTRRQRQCLELRGSVEESCRITDGGLEDDEAPLRAVADRCFCRQMDAGACRWLGGLDGGPVMMGRGNIHGGPVVGPACVRAPCGKFAGDEDPLPEACQ